jgi:splicing factor 3A subunit 1
MAPAPAMTSLDDIGKPPPGVVLPPKDIKTTIEKTAGFVVRNGTAFEERIRTKESTNPKFSFLHSTDPYNSFYLWRLSEIKDGRGTDVAAGRAGEQIAAREPEKPKGPPEPPEFEFSARMPTINAQDLDVVRLTALYSAKNGRSFMGTLLQREGGNFQFDFLRPQHSLYQYFTRLVDQYTMLIQGSTLDDGRIERLRIAALERNVKDRYQILERAKQRAEWAKYQEQQKVKKEEEAEAEKVAYAQIDWHDFVVVETVLFTEADEQAELPPPTSLSDLQTASLEQKAMMAVNPAHMRIEEAFPGDEPTYQSPTMAPPVQMPPPIPAYAGPTPPVPPMHPSMPIAVQMGNGFNGQPQLSEEEQRILERAEDRARAEQAQAAARAPTGQVKVRNDYVPRAQARRQNAATALCPNCKQQIPVDELENHMRSKPHPCPEHSYSKLTLCS